jgi:phage virion morphogenesis protein
MAGATASVTLDDRDLQQLFARLIDAGTDLGPVFSDIGEHLIESHQQRFEDQQSPDGEPWLPLKEKSKARKKKNRDKILIESGDLMGSLSYDVDSEGLLFGTNKIYGATHQFGDDDRNIPQREWLGLSNSDRDGIADILQAHLSDAI